MKPGGETERSKNGRLRQAGADKRKPSKCSENKKAQLRSKIADAKANATYAHQSNNAEAAARYERIAEQWEVELRKCEGKPTNFYRYQLPKWLGF